MGAQLSINKDGTFEILKFLIFPKAFLTGAF